MKSSTVLVVDDEPSMCELVETSLGIADIDVITCGSADEALTRLHEQNFDAVLTDVRMPGTSGLDLCQQICELRPDLPVVVMTAFGSMETAVSAMRNGAYDFITKPVEIQRLRLTMARAIEKHQLTSKIRLLEQDSSDAQRIEGLIGESEPMKNLIDQIERVAPSDATVLITGESGTGKELVARAIHRLSARSDSPFVGVNCGALSETLLESELFGHEKGAFTGAERDRRGMFLEAEGGMLLLDEIGDMPLPMQVKLLRALEERRLRPLGSDREIPFDVRIVAATHRDLETEVEENRFRQDLFYRINVIELHVPPLRARGTDVLRLAEHHIDHFAKDANKTVRGLSTPAAEKLLAYHWPGNVRELRNTMERAVALACHDTITVEDLPERIRQHQRETVFIGGQDPTELLSLQEVEGSYIRHVLNAVGGNRTQAAKILGVDRKTLYRKMREEDAKDE